MPRLQMQNDREKRIDKYYNILHCRIFVKLLKRRLLFRMECKANHCQTMIKIDERMQMHTIIRREVQK